jgi:hypothetical protein
MAWNAKNKQEGQSTKARSPTPQSAAGFRQTSFWEWRPRARRHPYPPTTLAELPAKLKALDEAGYAFAFVDTPPAITEAIERERSRGRNRLGRREEWIESNDNAEPTRRSARALSARPHDRRRVTRKVTREVTLPHPPIGASVTSSKQSIRHGSQALDFHGR